MGVVCYKDPVCEKKFNGSIKIQRIKIVLQFKNEKDPGNSTGNCVKLRLS